MRNGWRLLLGLSMGVIIGSTQSSGPAAGKLVRIEPGTFLMGSPPSEVGRHDDEAQFRVTLTHAYWIGATEVTVAQWREVMGTDLRGHLTKVIKDDTLYDFAGKQKTIRDFMNMSLDGDISRYLANEGDSLSMYFTSWNDAMAYCSRLTEREEKAGRLPAGYKYTLPTEAQWEYACRAGSTDATYGPVDKIAWYGTNSTEGYKGKSLGRTVAGPRTVGGKQPNAWGLFDMAGNLWEWCLDWYGPYPTGSAVDPTGPATGVDRVNRGGSWGSGAAAERSANRATNPQAEASAWRGFRIALSFTK
jgi:formylglycine-generating enzyme required for sulfatase activity